MSTSLIVSQRQFFQSFCVGSFNPFVITYSDRTQVTILNILKLAEYVAGCFKAQS